MEDRKEIRPVFEYTDDVGTHGFKEGDAVTCFSGSKMHTGTIVAFSSYRENKDADPQYSVYLDTSRNNMNRSCEVIKIEDITYMCKNQAKNLLGYPQTNETQDRSRFINMIVGLGHEKEKAKIMYESMREFTALYNIPLSSVLHDVIREVSLDADGKLQDGLTEIYNKLMGEVVQAFQANTDSLRKSLEEAIASQAGTQ